MSLFENRIWLARLNFFFVHDMLAMEKGGSRFYADSDGLFADAVLANMQHASTDPAQQQEFDEMDTALLDDALKATGYTPEEIAVAHELHRCVVKKAKEFLAAMPAKG